MRNTEDDTEAGELPFEITSDREYTRLQHYAKLADTWILAPLFILWNDWRARVGTVILILYGIMGTVGAALVEPTTTNEGDPFVQAFQTWEFPFGTDQYGQDVFALTVHATPDMLEMIIAGGVFTTVVATLVGVTAGYKGGQIDYILTGFTDIMINIPGLPLLVVLAAILEPEQPWVVGVILSVNAWAGLARSLRSQMLTHRDASYIEVSRIMGTPLRTIMVKDILPNLMPYIMINFVNAARNVIFAAVGLYFLGILPSSNLNWGIILNLAYESGALASTQMYHWLFAPLLAIVILSTGLILFSQGLDRIFNPRIRARHAKTVEDD